MHIIAMLLVGLVAGALAKLILPGRHNHSIVLTMLVGIAGSVLAGALGRAVGWYQTGVNGPGIIASTVGAIVLLGLYHLVVTRSGTATTPRMHSRF